MSNKKRFTINDIALAAGVSKTTVSRYINNQSHLLSEETYNRVKAIVDMVDYQPSHIARNLRLQTSNMIGVVISDITSPFSTSILIGIGEYLQKHDFIPIFVSSDDSIEKEIKNIESLLANGVDGLIINTSTYASNHLNDLALKGIPFVLCDRYVKDYNYDIVTNHHEKGIKALVQHLKDEGFTRPILFTQTWEDNSSRLIRRQSFINSVKEIYGYSPEEDIVLVSQRRNLTVLDGIKKILGNSKAEDKLAIIGINSVTTIRVYKVLTELGLNIPADIGLCGPEDWEWESELYWPTLVKPHITTLSVHPRVMGNASAKLLLKKIENPNLSRQEILLDYELSIQNSTLRNNKNEDFN